MTVKLVGSMTENWTNKMVGSMPGCWAKAMVVMRAGSRSGWVTVKIAG